MGSENLHEPWDVLSPATRDMHRAIVSLIEELEAVDWYQQRAEATIDPELKATLIHHRNEEIEHAMMNLEWIRRRSPVFDEHARTYLFTEGPITSIEKATKAQAAEAPATMAEEVAPAAMGSLGVGSLRARMQGEE